MTGRDAAPAPAWTPELAAARRVVFQELAATGAAPSLRRVARRLGIDDAAALARLRALHDLHQLVLEPEGDAIRMAHPFSAAPMGFVLRAADGRMWWGGCAWDSFGIVAALGEDLEITTRCPGCGKTLSLASGPSVRPPELVIRIPRPAAQWWDDVLATCGDLRLYCNEEHVRDDVRRRDVPLGAVVEAWRMWRLALSWYGDRLDPDYAPTTARDRQRLLVEQGFDEAFWILPGS
jgi:hypothetical protein